jgi:hypothetical protein
MFDETGAVKYIFVAQGLIVDDELGTIQTGQQMAADDAQVIVDVLKSKYGAIQRVQTTEDLLVSNDRKHRSLVDQVFTSQRTVSAVDAAKALQRGSSLDFGFGDSADPFSTAVRVQAIVLQTANPVENAKPIDVANTHERDRVALKWKTGGNEIAIADMSDKHLNNTIAYIERSQEFDPSMQHGPQGRVKLFKTYRTMLQERELRRQDTQYRLTDDEAAKRQSWRRMQSTSTIVDEVEPEKPKLFTEEETNPFVDLQPSYVGYQQPRGRRWRR